MGIASGSPTSDAIVLWTRLDPDAIRQAGLFAKTIPVTCQLAHDAQFSRIVYQKVIEASPALAHSVHAEVSGLDADRHYFYRFIAGTATSPLGKTHTLPAAHTAVRRLRLAYASCQQWGNGFYSAYRHMLEENLDLVMFLGDYMYEYPTSRPKDVRKTTGGWITTLDDYRGRYALHKSDTDLQAIHAAVPWLITWDDHEVQNDYAATREGESGPPVTDFMARRRAAYQAFYEHMPVRRANFATLLANENAYARIFSSTQYGRLATLYTLDNRQFRDPQACNTGDRPGASRIDPHSCTILNQAHRTLLGEEQEGWLKRQFERATSQWNVIGQQSLFGPRNFDTSGGQRIWNDGWDGYPQARQRLIDAMRQTKLSNPVMLGGDVHENWVGHILSDYSNPGSASVGVEFCGTSITSLSSRTPAQISKLLQTNPHFIFANAQYRGYGVAEFSPGQLTTTLRTVEDATDPASPISTLAEFSVESGQPVIHRRI